MITLAFSRKCCGSPSQISGGQAKLSYQLAFTTPGNAPRKASFLKHKRHILNRL